MITWHCFQKPLNSSIAEKLKQKIFSRWERPVRLQPQLIFEVAVQSEPKTQHTQECEFLRLWQLTACSSTVTVDVSVLQFLLIFRRAAAGELQEESGLMALARLSEINVSTEGVMGAKDFFEAKVTGHFVSPCAVEEQRVQLSTFPSALRQPTSWQSVSAFISLTGTGSVRGQQVWGRDPRGKRGKEETGSGEEAAAGRLQAAAVGVLLLTVWRTASQYHGV